MNVVGEAGDFQSARDKVLEPQPDVVTLDLSMPNGDAVRVIEELTKGALNTRADLTHFALKFGLLQSESSCSRESCHFA
jgi:DNA-binding NarL/FixJ family response regulator